VRLRIEGIVLAASIAAAAFPFAALPAPSESGDAEPSGWYIPRDDVRTAAARLRADPNLAGEEKVRQLRWTGSKRPAKSAASAPWGVGLFEFLSQSSSVLLWALGAVAAAVAIVWSARALTAPIRMEEIALPVVSRLRDMDLNPASLPADVGAAALALFEAGRNREALSLLYRAALSRAVFRHGVVIHESYTELEVIRAVNATLDPPRAAYIAELVTTWQRGVFGGEAVLHEKAARLCRTFIPTLDEALA
jgi:hypothetical protein